MNKRSQFYLILTVFIVSAFLVISSSLLSFKETTQINIEIPFSDLPKITASVETSVRNNLELTFERMERTGDISYLTNGVSSLISGQYLIQEGELGYFLDDIDLGIYTISDLTILGPSSFEIGLPEARLLRVEEGPSGYYLRAKPGLGNLLVELRYTGLAFDYIDNPYVYIIDENEDGIHNVGSEEVIYLTYDYTSSMRATKDGDTYLLGELMRAYAENGEITVRLGDMKQDHLLTVNYPNVNHLGTNYAKGEVIAIKEAGEVLGLIMVGEVDTQNNYLDYIVLNLQKEISGQEKRKVSFDPYPEEGLKDNEIYCNVYPERIESGDKVVITSIIHDNLSTEISDEDLACDNRITPSHIFEGNNFTDIESFGFFISEPFIEKEYEIVVKIPDDSGVLMEMGYHKDVKVDVIDGGTTFAICGNLSDLINLQPPNHIGLKEGESAEFLGSYIKVISIEGGAMHPYDVKIILKNPYLRISDGDSIDHTSLHELEDSYYVNVTNDDGLFFGDTSGTAVHNLDIERYKYVDLDGDTEYDYNETIILDSDLNGFYDSGEDVKGIPPLLDPCPLELFDANERYIDINNNNEYDSKDVIFIDNNPFNGSYDAGEPVIPTFYAGDFFVLEDFLCFIESLDTDVTGDFFRVVPVYTKGEQETFTHNSYRIFKGFDSDYNLDASKLVKFEYEATDEGWNFHDVDDGIDVYFNSHCVVHDSNATVDDGIVYAFFDGNASEINEKDFYHFKHNISYDLQGYDVRAVIDPANGHPDEFNFEIDDYEQPGTFTIFDIREGDTFFVAGQGYKVLGIYIDADPAKNSVFFVPVHSYQFNVITNLYKEKTLEDDPIVDEELRIQRYTSFLDIYEFYPEKEGTYSFYIEYYYWTDLHDYGTIDEDEISVVTEKYTFVVI